MWCAHILYFDTWFVHYTAVWNVPILHKCTCINLSASSHIHSLICVCLLSYSNSLYSFNSEIMFICIVWSERVEYGGIKLDKCNSVYFFSSYFRFKTCNFFCFPFFLCCCHLVRTFYWNWIESVCVYNISFTEYLICTIESKRFHAYIGSNKNI